MSNNIDPQTGKPYDWAGGTKGARPWTGVDPNASLNAGDQQYAPGTSMGLSGMQITPEFLKQIGYTGDPNILGHQTINGDGTEVDPAFTKYLQDKNIHLGYNTTGEGETPDQNGVIGHGHTLLGAFDGNDNQLGQSVGSVNDGGDGAALAAMMMTGGFGAATLGGLGAAGAASSGGTGAADAAGMSLAEGAYPASLTGGEAAAGAGGGMSSADLAALHSAEGYGAAASPAELAGGASAGSSALSPLQQAAQYGKTAQSALGVAKYLLPLVGGIAGGSRATPAPTPGGMGTASAPTTGYLADPAQKFGYSGFNAGAMPAARAGHTRGPSSAVNLNDPSATMFGYGKTPLYFQSPPQAAATDTNSKSTIPQNATGMAEGGTVNDDYGNPLTLDGPAPAAAPPDDPSNGNAYGMMGGPNSANTGSDKHFYDLPDVNEGPMGWITRLLGGTGSYLKGHPAMALGGLGLLASLLSNRNQGPGYKSASQLRADVGGNQNGAPMGAGAQSYFNSPARSYTPPQSPFQPRRAMAVGGPVDAHVPGNRFVSPGGQGGGQDDTVDAVLAPGEYVHPADIVSHLGDGNNAEGARKLRQMEESIRAHKRSTPTNKLPPRALSPLEYMKGGA